MASYTGNKEQNRASLGIWKAWTAPSSVSMNRVPSNKNHRNSALGLFQQVFHKRKVTATAALWLIIAVCTCYALFGLRQAHIGLFQAQASDGGRRFSANAETFLNPLNALQHSNSRLLQSETEPLAQARQLRLNQKEKEGPAASASSVTETKAKAEVDAQGEENKEMANKAAQEAVALTEALTERPQAGRPAHASAKSPIAPPSESMKTTDPPVVYKYPTVSPSRPPALLVPPPNSVSCGGHFASTCAECPRGNGEDWCNGSCHWCRSTQTCMDKLHTCPTNRWMPPEPEPWFIPPDPIDKYNRTISVILPCGSENLFFQRTIQSIFAATPPEILYEIIVVDDNSQPPLEPSFEFDKEQYKVKFVRSNVSLGLIAAKHQGAMVAKGDIIFFLDCHCKPALGYWEPFVREISQRPTRAVVPVISNLEIETWEEYNRPTEEATAIGGGSKCYVTFDGEFKWTTDTTPWVPIASGGLVAIGREWFFKIGGHDEAMKGWGGENIDLSLRVWRCGGDIVAAPRSFVAHMWRESSKKKTHALYWNDDIPHNASTVNRGRAMLAHATNFFYNKTLTFPEFEAAKDLDARSIQQTMDDLKCKSFDWYLDHFSHIYRDGGVIPKEVFQLTYDGGKTCLQLGSGRQWGSSNEPVQDTLVLRKCVNETGLEVSKGTQYWSGSNRMLNGKCCDGLRAWNTDQCINWGAKTDTCNLNGGQPAKLTDEGQLNIGYLCLTAEPKLKATLCERATKTWEKIRAFQPQEFTIMTKEMQERW